jgi:hypothetical protein
MEGMGERTCSRNWWVEEYDDGKFRIMAGDNHAVMCRGDRYLSRKYAKRMGEWMFEHGSHPAHNEKPMSDKARHIICWLWIARRMFNEKKTEGL